MNFKKTDNGFLIILEKGEEIVETLLKFLEEQNISSGYFSGMGAISEVELAHYNLETKEYSKKIFHRAIRNS